MHDLPLIFWVKALKLVVSSKKITLQTDKYVEEHLNCILDALYHWKNHSRIGDASLEGIVN